MVATGRRWVPNALLERTSDLAVFCVLFCSVLFFRFPEEDDEICQWYPSDEPQKVMIGWCTGWNHILNHYDILRLPVMRTPSLIDQPAKLIISFSLVFFCVCGSTLTRSLFVLLHNPCVSCAGLTFEISFMLVLFLFSRLIKKQPISLDIWRKKDGFWNKYVSTSDLIQSTDGWGR